MKIQGKTTLFSLPCQVKQFEWGLFYKFSFEVPILTWSTQDNEIIKNKETVILDNSEPLVSLVNVKPVCSLSAMTFAYIENQSHLARTISDRCNLSPISLVCL